MQGTRKIRYFKFLFKSKRKGGVKKEKKKRKQLEFATDRSASFSYRLQTTVG